MKISTGVLIVIALITTAFTSSYITTKLHERNRVALEQAATSLVRAAYVTGCVQGLETMMFQASSTISCVALMQLQAEKLKVQIDPIRGIIPVR